MAELHLLISRHTSRQVNPLVQLLPTKHMLVDQHFSQDEFIVKAARAIGIRIQLGKRKIIRRFTILAHAFPFLCRNTLNMLPCLTNRNIGTTISKPINPTDVAAASYLI